MNSLDKLFAQFTKSLFLLLCFYGAGMILVIILGKDQLALKLVNVWSTMFGAIVGLGSGYLLGRTRSTYDESHKQPGTGDDDSGIRSSE